METTGMQTNSDGALFKRLWPVIDVYGRVARAAARADAAAPRTAEATAIPA